MSYAGGTYKSSSSYDSEALLFSPGISLAMLKIETAWLTVVLGRQVDSTPTLPRDKPYTEFHYLVEHSYNMCATSNNGVRWRALANLASSYSASMQDWVQSLCLGQEAKIPQSDFPTGPMSFSSV